MKVLKQFFMKRVFVLMLCTVVLSSTVFFSYENTMVVKAADESDLIYDFVVVSLAAVGVFATGGTAGALALAIAPALADSGKDIYDYVTENEDGTTTISADLVNLVLQAYKEYKDSNGEKFDGTMLPGEDGYYYFPQLTYSVYVPGEENKNITIHWSDIYTRYPCALLLRNNFYDGRNLYVTYAYVLFYNSFSDEFYCMENIYENKTLVSGIVHPTVDTFLCPIKSHKVIVDGSISDEYFTKMGNGLFGRSFPGATVIVSSSSIPTYTDLSTLKEGLKTGDFSSAHNYGKTPDGETSSYTGIYEGGDITVDTEKLDSISDKLAELEESSSNIEDILKELLEWLRLNEGGGSGGGGDVIVDVDLTETNSWLSKIFQKLDEFNENFKSFFIFKDAPGINAKYISSILERILEQLRGTGQVDPGEPEDPDGSGDSIIEAALAKIQKSIEDLNAMLQKYLKSISSDLGDLKDQLEDMSEQEFSDQTESFLDDTMDSFWEISEKAKGKFPFSIPNDIRLLISKMSVSQPEDPGQGTYSVMTMAYDEDVGNNSMILVLDESGDDVPVISETGAPIFYLPFVIASASIEEYVLIDLSGFEPVSSFCRSLMTIWFILCLYNLTFKVMGLWGDLVD